MSQDALEVAIARCAAGLPVAADGLGDAARRSLAVAERLGAPRAPALRAAATSEQQAQELAWAVDRAAAEGRSVARALVAVPPLLGPATALLVTDAPFAVWGTSLGRGVLLVAGVLWVLGGLVVHRMIRRATRPPRPAGAGPSDELLDVVAVALSAGVTLPSAVRTAATVVPAQRDGAAAAALWLELGAPGPPPVGWAHVGRALADAQRDGVPLVGLVRSLAGRLRAEAHQAALERAARLGARLTIPTTLLLLPAAVLLVAAPLLDGALALLR